MGKTLYRKKDVLEMKHQGIGLILQLPPTAEDQTKKMQKACFSERWDVWGKETMGEINVT